MEVSEVKGIQTVRLGDFWPVGVEEFLLHSAFTRLCIQGHTSLAFCLQSFTKYMLLNLTEPSPEGTITSLGVLTPNLHMVIRDFSDITNGRFL